MEKEDDGRMTNRRPLPTLPLTGEELDTPLAPRSRSEVERGYRRGVVGPMTDYKKILLFGESFLKQLNANN